MLKQQLETLSSKDPWKNTWYNIQDVSAHDLGVIMPYRRLEIDG